MLPSSGFLSGRKKDCAKEFCLRSASVEAQGWGIWKMKKLAFRTAFYKNHTEHLPAWSVWSCVRMFKRQEYSEKHPGAFFAPVLGASPREMLLLCYAETGVAPSGYFGSLPTLYFLWFCSVVLGLSTQSYRNGEVWDSSSFPFKTPAPVSAAGAPFLLFQLITTTFILSGLLQSVLKKKRLFIHPAAGTILSVSPMEMRN